jgi:hypothetical protein
MRRSGVEIEIIKRFLQTLGSGDNAFSGLNSITRRDDG